MTRDQMVDISPAVIGLGFGVDQDSEEFWSVLFEADFQSGLDVVDTGEGHVIADGDVAGDIETSANAFEDEFVRIDDFRGFGGDRRGDGARARHPG